VNTQTGNKPSARMDPRIRERRIEVQRALGRRRLRVLLVVAVAVVAVGVAYLVVQSPLLDIDRVRVQGAKHLRADEIRSAAGVRLHDALVFADTGAIVRRVERLPWVEHASVYRDFPGTLRVAVTEYEPVAFARDGSQFALFAANGRAIARVPRPPDGAVELRGVRHPPADGQLLSPPEAADLVARLPADLARRVAAVDIARAGLALVLKGGGAIRLGTPDAIDAKAQAARAVLASGTVPTCFAYLDVSTPQTPVLRAC
jgi:cell division protein FtsQ